MSLKVRLSTLLSLAAVLSGCASRVDEVASKGRTPVLAVEQKDYRFSMYPQYVDESKSLIKLDVRDKEARFVNGAEAIANLKALDGHTQQVTFLEDVAIEKYVAEVALKHHEDYVVETDVRLGKEKFSPEFVFHCGDPVPELVDLK
jgi:hypothetical protein